MVYWLAGLTNSFKATTLSKGGGAHRSNGADEVGTLAAAVAGVGTMELAAAPPSAAGWKHGSQKGGDAAQSNSETRRR